MTTTMKMRITTYVKPTQTNITDNVKMELLITQSRESLRLRWIDPPFTATAASHLKFQDLTFKLDEVAKVLGLDVRTVLQE